MGTFEEWREANELKMPPIDEAGVNEGPPTGQRLVVFTFDRIYTGTDEQVEASRVRLERALQVVCHDDDLALVAIEYKGRVNETRYSVVNVEQTTSNSMSHD
jgi:hypothetical protein